MTLADIYGKQITALGVSEASNNVSGSCFGKLQEEHPNDHKRIISLLQMVFEPPFRLCCSISQKYPEIENLVVRFYEIDPYLIAPMIVRWCSEAIPKTKVSFVTGGAGVLEPRFDLVNYGAIKCPTSGVGDE